MHLDLYTSNSALTHKAKFWCNYVGALKDRGPDGLAVLESPYRPKPRPSIWSLYRPVDITMYDLLYEDEWRQYENFTSLTPAQKSNYLEPEYNDRIHSIGKAYNPVHTETYGTLRHYRAL